MDRRTFLQRSGLVALTSPLWACAPNSSDTATPEDVSASSADAQLARIGITTVCIRSRFPMSRTMMAEPYTGPDLNLETAPEFIANELGLHKVEVWDFHFDDTSIAYCERVRNAAARAGSSIINIQVDDLPDLSDPNPDVRARGVAQAKEWIDRAVALGSPRIRVQTGGGEGQTFEVAVTADSYRQIAAYGQEKNVTVLVENFLGFSADIDNVVAIVETVDHPMCRALADFGNTPPGSTENQVAGLRKMFPYLAFVSAKGTGFNAQYEHSDYDVGALVRATEASGYTGIYSIEMWPDADSQPPADPLRAANWMKETILANLRA
jgi:sugar phosphate isomerase/epimerase